MTGNLSQDWPAYILMVVVVLFFAYVIVKGNIQNKKNNRG